MWKRKIQNPLHLIAKIPIYKWVNSKYSSNLTLQSTDTMKRTTQHTQQRTFFERYHHYILTGVCLLFIVISMAITGCDLIDSDDGNEEEIPTATSEVPAVLPIFVADEEGTPLETVETIDPSAVLYGIRQPDNAVVDPEGNPISWEEYDNVQGNVTVECVERGTRLTVELSGLIPGGLYTIWNVILEKPGFGGSLQSLLGSIVGVAPMGAPDGTESEFRASAEGTAQITEITPAGSMLQFPDVDEDWPDKRGIKDCALNEYEYHVVGDYHYDDKTHGNIPGPAGTHVEQFGFVFKQNDFNKIEIDLRDRN